MVNFDLCASHACPLVRPTAPQQQSTTAPTRRLPPPGPIVPTPLPAAAPAPLPAAPVAAAPNAAAAPGDAAPIAATAPVTSGPARTLLSRVNAGSSLTVLFRLNGFLFRFSLGNDVWL